MAIRANDGTTALFEPQEIGRFEVAGMLFEYGLHGERANILARDSVPLVLPYEWYYPNGVATPVQITPAHTAQRLSLD